MHAIFRLDTEHQFTYPWWGVKSHELENLRRSVAMSGLSREQAIRLLDQLDSVQADLERLRTGLRRLLDESEPRT